MNSTKKMFTFLMVMLMILSVFATTSVASADNPPVQGPTVTADPNSPTGYTVTFVYYNPNATGVRLAGDLTLLDVNTGPSIRYQPEEWQLGRYHVGGVEFLRDMTEDAAREVRRRRSGFYSRRLDTARDDCLQARPAR